MPDRYSIALTLTAYGHLEALRRYDRNRVLGAIKEQLAFSPDEETRNKKLLRANPVADWELRVQPFRVFYEVDKPNASVRVVAVGRKRRDRLIMGDQEIQI